VVDEHLDGEPLFLEPVEHRAGRCPIAEVHRAREDPQIPARPCELGGELLEAILPPRDQDQAPHLAPELARDLPADARRPAPDAPRPPPEIEPPRFRRRSLSTLPTEGFFASAFTSGFGATSASSLPTRDLSSACSARSASSSSLRRSVSRLPT